MTRETLWVLVPIAATKLCLDRGERESDKDASIKPHYPGYECVAASWYISVCAQKTSRSSLKHRLGQTRLAPTLRRSGSRPTDPAGPVQQMSA
jgi:hypothetical protein